MLLIVYCILNIYNDGSYGNWLTKGIEVRDKYINLWAQIANVFKDYNNYLIFESMDEVYYYNPRTYNFDYDTLFNLNQAFVDTVRNTGWNNIERLLTLYVIIQEKTMIKSYQKWEYNGNIKD